MSILGFLFFIIVGVFILGFSIIGNILRAIFGLGKRTTTSSSSQQTNSSQQSRKQKVSDPVQRKKLFDKDEGEYVEYEEVDTITGAKRE